MEDERSRYSAPLYGDEGAVNSETAQPAGFTRHQSSNARRLTARKPPREREPRDASAGRQPERTRPAEPRRARSASNGDDYLGVGAACRVCGNPVDESQSRCPHCGAFVRPLYTSVPFWIAVAVCLALVIVLSATITSCRSTGDDAQVPSQAVDADQDGATTDGQDGAGDAPASDASSSGTDTSALQYALTNAQFVLDASANSHSYTYSSLRNLQAAVDAAQAVLDAPTSTADEIAAAAQSVSDVLNGGLATVLDEGAYPQPLYSDLLSTYVGQQVSVSGTVTSVTVGEDGITTVVFDKDDYEGYSVYAQCYSWMVGDSLAVGMNFEVCGTDLGGNDGCPVIFADTVAYW
jgi:hypothetical protein